MTASVSTVQAVSYLQSTSDQCNTATVTLNIQAQLGDKYNVTNFTVAPGACVAVAFKNVDTIDHTFTIDGVNSSSYTITYFNIYLKANQNQTVNFQTPNTNITIKYYCAIPGHETIGQYGNLTVGTGTPLTNTTSTNIAGSTSQISTSTPSFEAVTVILAITTSIIVFSRIKRFRK